MTRPDISSPEPSLARWRQRFLHDLSQPLPWVEGLFDRQSDMVFSIKDRNGRYVAISQACAERCGLAHQRDAIGRTAQQLFPAHMAERYTAQDEQLFRTGEPVLDNLDLTLFANRQPGWCLSTKLPLHDRQGRVIGLACLSRDLEEPSRSGMVDARIAAVVDLMLARHAEPLGVEMLAEQAGLNVAQFERRMKKIFRLSPSQYLTKLRIDAAARLLQGSERRISDIALDCGFCDQSALTKQFRALTGLTPHAFRRWVRALDCETAEQA